MKLAVCIFICSVLAPLAKTSAQIDKGDWTLGLATTLNPSGNNSVLGFGYSYDTDLETETFQYNLAPRVGYVIKNNLTIGLDLILTHSKSDRNKNTFIGAGPFARYYFKGGLLRPYLEAQASYGNLAIEADSAFFGEQDFDVRYLLMGGAAGLAFPIKDIVHIDLAAAYSYQSGAFVEDDIETNSHNIGLKLGVTLFLDQTVSTPN